MFLVQNLVSEQKKTAYKMMSEEKIICKAKRSDWGWGGGQHYNRIQPGGMQTGMQAI